MEIAKHADKILRITKYSEKEFHEMEYLVTKNIRFMNHLLIDEHTLSQSEKMLKNIDINDAPFLALSIFLKAPMWTGDKRLSNGLIKSGYSNICTTDQLIISLKS